MAASATDKLSRTANGGIPAVATVQSNRTAGVNTLSVDTQQYWPTLSGIKFSTYKVGTDGKKVGGSQTDWEGISNGTNSISSMIRTGGAVDAGNAVGDKVQMGPTAQWAEDLIEALLSAGITQGGGMGAIAPTSVAATGDVSATGNISDNGITLKTVRSEMTFDYIASGCVLSGTGYGSTLVWSLTPGVVYIGGRRLTVVAASGTVTASKDTYFDLLDSGSGTVATLVNTAGNIVANNAASPALAASSARIGIIVSGASTIAAAASINQGQPDRVLPIASGVAYRVSDSLGNPICPHDPSRKLLGYAEQVAGSATTSASYVDPTNPVQTTIKTPANCYSIRLVAEMTVSSNTANANYNVAISDGFNATQIERSWATIDANAAHLGGISLTRVVPVTPNTTYTYKIRHHTNGTASGVLNQGDGATSPITLRIEQA